MIVIAYIFLLIILLIVLLAIIISILGGLYWLGTQWVKCKKWIAKKRRNELIRICTEPDVDKLISLLEKGLDPNTKVKRTYWDGESYSCPTYKTVYEPLIEVAGSNKLIQDLLIAYGAKTMEELEAEERAEKAKAAERYEAERLAREAAKEAKKASDIAKVEALLRLKAKKA